MKWLTKIVRVMKVGLVAFQLFEAAKVDGVITLEEMTAGVQALLEAAGLADDIKITLDQDDRPAGLDG